MDKFTKINEVLERDARGYAYKGYLVRYVKSMSVFTITKNGFHIGSEATRAKALTAIDELTS